MFSCKECAMPIHMKYVKNIILPNRIYQFRRNNIKNWFISLEMFLKTNFYANCDKYIVKTSFFLLQQ